MTVRVSRSPGPGAPRFARCLGDGPTHGAQRDSWLSTKADLAWSVSAWEAWGRQDPWGSKLNLRRDRHMGTWVGLLSAQGQDLPGGRAVTVTVPLSHSLSVPRPSLRLCWGPPTLAR